MLFLPIALACFAVAFANRVTLDEDYYSQVCEGMYAKHDWGGNKHPHIGIRLNEFNKVKYDPKDPKKSLSAKFEMSFVIFEYKDLDKLGVSYGDSGRKKYVCDDVALEAGLCSQKQYGNFIASGDVSNTTIYISKLTELGTANITYPVVSTGYYCVSTFSTSTSATYKGYVNFQNAFGQLSASQIPQLPAYGILTLCYAVTLALYGFQFFKKRDQNQILPLQKYLMAMLSFLTFDTLVVWSYYDLVNRTVGTSWFVRFYVIFLSVLSSAKMTFAFFLLLCIALGYGVVILKLSKKVMFRCKILAGLHFAASLLYLIGSYSIGSTNSTTSSTDLDSLGAPTSLWQLLIFIPVTITLTAYYFLILTSIRQTTANLHKQRQIIKLQLYQNLFRIISLSVLLTIGGLVLSSFIFLSMSNTQIVEQNWKGSYFIVDFWPSVTFFSIFLGVAWLWRPTETSYMLAVSQQLSTGEGEEGDETGPGGYQHGHEFELDDVSLMSHSDEENGHRDSFELETQNIPDGEPPKYDENDKLGDTEPRTEASNTLFELEEEDVDEEHRLRAERSDSDSLDNRLR